MVSARNNIGQVLTINRNTPQNAHEQLGNTWLGY